MNSAAGAAVVCVLIAACATSGPPRRLATTTTLAVAQPASVGMNAGLNAQLDSIVMAALAEGAAPGAALVVARYGRLVHVRGYGRTHTGLGAPAVTDSTIYDLASLTKVVGTTTAAMILEEEGKLDLQQPVHRYLPELNAPEKAAITVEMMLSHRGGLEAGAGLWREARGDSAYLHLINSRRLAYTPGDSTIYSDWDLVLTGILIERIAGKPLEVFLKERVWGPLRMRDTGFNPVVTAPIPADSDCTAVPGAGHPLLLRIAPTELDTVYRKRQIHGIVHDENACALGGVAGHAGLFSSARDLAVFAQMMLNGGEYAGLRLLRPVTIARWTARVSPRSSRALGWDTPAQGASSGRFFSPRSFGHTGFTGTSIWLDPERGLFVVLLTNRVNLTRRSNRHEALRRDVADAAQAAILDAPLVEWLR